MALTTYSRIWVRQFLGRAVVCLKSERFLSVECEYFRKWSRMVLGKDLTVTARENSTCLAQGATSDKVSKTFPDILYNLWKSLKSNKKI